MKFVTPLNEATRKQLHSVFHDDTSFKRRLRAHAVLLSNRRYTIDQLADIFDADRDTVSIWLTNWEEHAFDGLSDAARPGRPRKTSAEEDAMILREVDEHPQQSKTAIAALQKKRFASAPRRFAVVSRKLGIASSGLSSALPRLLTRKNTSDARSIWQNLNAAKSEARLKLPTPMLRALASKHHNQWHGSIRSVRSGLRRRVMENA